MQRLLSTTHSPSSSGSGSGGSGSSVKLLRGTTRLSIPTQPIVTTTTTTTTTTPQLQLYKSGSGVRSYNYDGSYGNYGGGGTFTVFLLNNTTHNNKNRFKTTLSSSSNTTTTALPNVTVTLKSRQFSSSSVTPPQENSTTTATNTTNASSNVQQSTTASSSVITRSRVWLRDAINNKTFSWQNMKAWLKETVNHYWAGTKLFALETKTSFKILMRLLNGHALTRREHRQLVRTVSDMIRLIPFLVIVIVPFMEFALPLLLRLFPNMLPSTFEDKLKKEETLKKVLKARIEVAKFLQDTLEETSKDRQMKATTQGLNFSDFMRKVRSGEAVSNSEILQFSKVFEDELTLDNLSRAQLVAMCKYIGVPPYGPDSLLQFLLNKKLKQIKQDDKMIQREGIDNLTLEELKAALRARGMRTGLGNMKQRLRDWLELSLEHNLPGSLLLLSRTLLITESAKSEEVLKDAIASLPEELLGEVKLKVDKEVSSDVKLEVVRRQNELMAAEREKEIKEKVSEIKQEEKVKVGTETKQEEEKIKEKLKELSEVVQILATPSPVQKERDELQELKADREKLEREKKQQGEREKKDKEEKQIIESKEQVAKEEERVTKEKEKQKIDTERAEKEKLQPPLGEADQAKLVAEEKVQKEQIAKEEEKSQKVIEEKAKREQEERERLDKEEAKSRKAQKVIEQKLDAIIKDLEVQVEKVEKTVGTKLHVIDTDQDGVISTTEFQQAVGLLKEKLSDEEIDAVIKKIDRDHDGRISVTELLQFAEQLNLQKEAPSSPPPNPLARTPTTAPPTIKPQ